MLCVWYIWWICFHKDHACFRLKMYGVMLIFILVWYIMSYASRFYFVTHTCTPRMQWFRGSLLCVLVCANWHLRSFMNSIYIAHNKGEPLINHWIQKPNCLYLFVSFNRVVINHQKGGIESASSPLVDFGWLNDNTIKRSNIFSKCETRNWLSHRCLMKPKWCVVV